MGNEIIPGGNDNVSRETEKEEYKEFQEQMKRAEMPLPEKPAADASPEQILNYRTEIARRHLREALIKRKDGTYHGGNFLSLFEIFVNMSDVEHHEFRSLYDKIAKKLADEGARLESSLSGVTEAQVKEMIQMIAQSDVPLREETSHEVYMHKNGHPEYVAEDSTIYIEIRDMILARREKKK